MDKPEVIIKEVILRDGLQNLPEFIPTEGKIEIFRMLLKSGLRNIEFTSFVSPKAIPQFKDAPQVSKAVLSMKPKEVEVSALIPNFRGAELALENGVRKMGFVLSVSTSHNISNVRRTPEESIEELKRILDLKEKYPDMIVKPGMATAFGCPFEGKIPAGVILKFARRFYDLGFREMGMADTVGFGNPKEVKEACRLATSEFPDVTFSVHLHNTRGLGPANAFAAYESGIRILDGAVGGLGGCPFAPGARGNTATEDLVYLFEDMGIKTGVNIDALLETARYFQTLKKDVCFSSSILEAGIPKYRGAITKEGFEQKWNINT